MGRSPSSDEGGVKKGPWTPEEDRKLVEYIQKHGHGSWRALPRHAGLNRCGKSCRLRWTNYLRPDIKRGKFSDDEERLILHLHSILGNKWSAMAARLPGRTDNEIKNYWNTHLRKKLLQMGIDPVTHRPRADLTLLANLSSFLPAAGNLGSSTTGWDPADAAVVHLVRFQLLQSVVRAIVTNFTSTTDLVSLLGSVLPSSLPAGLLDGALGPLHPGPAAVPQMPSDDLHLLEQSCAGLGGGGGLAPPTDVSSSKASASGDHQMSSSYGNVLTGASTPSTLASVSPEHVGVEHELQDMLYAGDEWRDLSEPDSDLYWGDILEQTGLESWPITS